MEDDKTETISNFVNLGYTVGLDDFNYCETCGHCRKSEPCKHCGKQDLQCEKLGIDVESDFYCKHHTLGQRKFRYPYTPTIPTTPWYPEPNPLPTGPIWICNDNNTITVQDKNRKSTNVSGDTK